MRGWILMAAAGLVAVPATVQAQGFSGAEQIGQGDLAAAEQEIERQRRIFPNDADLLINLAHVYARTDRMPQARQLYREVLSRPNEELELADGRMIPAHVLASEGLRRTSVEVLANR